MDTKAFKQLVEKAKSDAAFFHALVFKPEDVIGKIDLDRTSKGAILAHSAAELVARLVGINQECGNTCTSSCDNTCGGSCGYTTNLQGRFAELVNVYFSRRAGDLMECGNTCTSSCDNTCGGSCGYTTNFQGFGSWGMYR